ncbi:chloride channel [Hyaloraphidium curvatum]|nr:chloride channel [Hyaloraphidium curvatum]
MALGVDADAARAALLASPPPAAVVSPELYAEQPRGLAPNRYPTIDWVRDGMLDRRRRRAEFVAARTSVAPTLSAWAIGAADAARPWAAATLAGLMTGLLAASVAVFTAFLVDVKTGVCRALISDGRKGWYLPKRACCLGAVDADAGDCPEWQPWSELLGVPGSYLADYGAFTAFSVLFAMVSCLCVVTLAPWAGGEGIPELKTVLGGNRIPGLLSPTTLLVKAAGLPLAIGSGLSVGKEGALIHVAACLGGLALRLVGGASSESRNREMLSSAAAAGIAVAFGAPIGGVLFSLEEVSTFFPLKTVWRSMLCAMVAAVTMQIMDPYRGKRVVFEVLGQGEADWKMFELPAFIVLGAIGAAYGGFFISVNMKVQAWREWLYAPAPAPPQRDPRAPAPPPRSPFLTPLLDAFALALLTAVLFYPSPLTRLDDLRVLELLFRDCPEPGSTLAPADPLCPAGPVARTKLFVVLALTASLKTFLTAATYSLPVPSSVFIPGMAVGALLGRAVGMLVQGSAAGGGAWFGECRLKPDEECVGLGRYALLGAVGALGGITRLTVSLVVIMFELTGQLSLVVPSMVCLVSARIASDLMGIRRGFADECIRAKGYPYLDPNDDRAPQGEVRDCMTPLEELVTLPARGEPAERVGEKMGRGYHGFPVADGELMAGWVQAADVRRVLDGLQLAPGAWVRFDGRGRTNGRRVWVGGAPVYVEEEAGDGEAIEMVGDAGVGRVRAADLASIVDPAPITLNPHLPAAVAVDLFRKVGPRCVVVTRRGRLRGVLTKKDLLVVLDSMDAEPEAEEGMDEEEREIAGTVGGEERSWWERLTGQGVGADEIPLVRGGRGE